MPRLASPVAPHERIDVLDALRGFAVFGIFIANLLAFAGWYWMPPDLRAGTALAGLNGAAEFLLHAAVEGKFYTIFSLLFGVGFALQMQRGEARGGPWLGVYHRRLAVLLAIGLVHLVVVWPGDILTLYALLGLLLVPFRRASDRTLVIAAAVLVLLPVPQYLLAVATGGAFDPGRPLAAMGMTLVERGGGPPTAPDGTPLPPGAGLYLILAHGGWGDVLLSNVVGAFFRWADLLVSGRLPKVLAMFLLGLWVGRRAVAVNLVAARPLLRRVLVVGMALGIPANIALAWTMANVSPWPPSLSGLGQSVLYALGVAPLGLAYAAGFALLWLRETWRSRLAVLGPVGRMALSNYLLQTLLGIGLFYGIGLGWMGAVGPALFLPLAAAVFLLQIGVSNWWLKRFAYGPAEWVWRQITYGERVTLRRAAVGSGSV